MLIGVISEKEKSVICESCLGFPVAQTVKNLPAMQETQVRSLGREDALEKGMNGNPLQYSCLENPWTEEPGGLQWRIPGQRSLAGYSPWVANSQTRLSNWHFHFHFLYLKGALHLKEARWWFGHCVLSDFCHPMDCTPPGSCQWDFPGKNTRVGFHFLLQGIFLTQGSNLVLLYWRQILNWLSQQRSPERSQAGCKGGNCLECSGAPVSRMLARLAVGSDCCLLWLFHA